LTAQRFGEKRDEVLDSVTFTIIGAVIAVLNAVSAWATSSPEPNNRGKRWHQHIALLAAAFTAYGSWRAFVISEEKTWQQAEVQFQNDWLQRQQLKDRLRYERDLRAQTGELAKKSDELAKKSTEIASLNRTIAASVTGGNSFCYLSVESTNSRDQLHFVIVSKGKYPLYGVQARIVDLEAKFPTTLDALLRQQALSVGDLAPESAIANPQWVIKNQGGSTARRFNIFFSARNGFFEQFLRAAWVNGSWVSATQVRRDGKQIFEQIQKNFPRNERGEVDWTGH
jgi:hypothetical protein